MTDSLAQGRIAIRQMVEDFWRSFLAVARTSPETGVRTIEAYEERLSSTSSLMSQEKSAQLLAAVEEEREIIFVEYKCNPEALKQRLGLPSEHAPLTIGKGQSVGELAVRTAVRATVWDAISGLFRLFR